MLISRPHLKISLLQDFELFTGLLTLTLTSHRGRPPKTCDATDVDVLRNQCSSVGPFKAVAQSEDCLLAKRFRANFERSRVRKRSRKDCDSFFPM